MFTRTSLALLGLMAALAGSAAAQGIVIDRRIRPPEPQPRRVQVESIRIKSHAIETVIDGQSATTTVTQTFFNPNGWQLEGTYMFPLPAEAAIDSFEMTMNGKMVKGELLPADKARSIYEETVRRMVDPGLLEYAGRGLFQARVFPILPQQDLTIKFTYSELLRFDSGLVRFGYPLRTRNYCVTAPESVTAKVTIKQERAMQTIYSPTHRVEVIRKGDNEAVIGLEMKGEQPANDFEVFFGYADGPLSANVMSFREDDKAGYFLALLTPKIKLAADELLPKDVVIVMDTSGSMDEDGKIAQARKAMKFVVGKLNAKDRFAVVSFSTMVRKLHETLVDASEANKTDALDKIEKLEATGGTNMEGAIKAAYELAGSDAKRPCYVLFFTDGLPTMGEITDVRALAKLSAEKRPAHVRMFTFGVGYDVNTWLLDTMAEEGKGQREYVKPKEDMEVKVSNFAGKISAPVLSDVKLRIDGAEVHDLHPQMPGDLFAGTQLSVTGRYDKPGKRQLVLEGTVNGEKRAFEYTIELAEKDTGKNYLPRMWAVRRVGYLMDQISLKGHNEELAKEIIKLGTQFGIVTPYTSFLIVEDTPPPRPGTPMPEDRRRDERWNGGQGDRGGAGRPGLGGGAQAPSAQTGEEAVKKSEANTARRENNNADDAKDAEEGESSRLAEKAKGAGYRTKTDSLRKQLEDKGLSKEAAAKEAEQVVKTVGTRSFLWSDGVWLESDLTNAELFGAEVVEYMSERYFEIARKDDGTAKVLALGNEVVLRVGSKTIRVVDKTQTAEGEKKDKKEEGGKSNG
ncbi:MAG: VWA domain-containing protein [Planctomycetes bacterium]|nr:VWA domain-containing protein [Planctomycetota bacterium]